MKRKYYFIITLLLLNIPSLQAQTTSGRDFWLTFGDNAGENYTNVKLQIRIVSGSNPTQGTIYFTDLETSVPFSMGAHEVFTYILDNTQTLAVYNTTMGKNNKSIHITSSQQVTVYAMNMSYFSSDATNILPITALDTVYYQISYLPIQMPGQTHFDAYAIIATEDHTEIFHDGAPITTLHKGQVYYRTALQDDMTGAHITANKPVALFAMNPLARIPPRRWSICFMLISASISC